MNQSIKTGTYVTTTSEKNMPTLNCPILPPSGRYSWEDTPFSKREKHTY